MSAKSVAILVGARPNFVKGAPLLRGFETIGLRPSTLHTGQHFDASMSDNFFRALDIPNPDYHLGVKARSRIGQVAEIVGRLEAVFEQVQPRMLCVIGDVTSTLAGTVAAASCNIPVAHIEAGLRSFDRSMPEEINRVMTDSISEWFFVSEPAGVEHLTREGQSVERIHMVGDLICDALRQHEERARAKEEWNRFGVQPGEYGVVTLHRPVNVDQPEALAECLGILEAVSQRVPLLWPLHPRTRQSLDRCGLRARLSQIERLTVCEPLDYLQFLSILTEARVVLSDSGGIQLEATLLDIPCLTLRTTTERPMTIDCGTNTLVGRDARLIEQLVTEILERRFKRANLPEYWDGQTAERIVQVLQNVA